MTQVWLLSRVSRPSTFHFVAWRHLHFWNLARWTLVFWMKMGPTYAWCCESHLLLLLHYVLDILSVQSLTLTAVQRFKGLQLETLFFIIQQQWDSLWKRMCKTGDLKEMPAWGSSLWSGSQNRGVCGHWLWSSEEAGGSSGPVWNSLGLGSLCWEGSAVLHTHFHTHTFTDILTSLHAHRHTHTWLFLIIKKIQQASGIDKAKGLEEQN